MDQLERVMNERPDESGEAGPVGGYRCMAQPPETFVPRHQLDNLLELLCAATERPQGGANVAITTALRGAGGFGKTTLAQALCFEPRVRQAYPAGILWVTLGEHPSNEELMGHVRDLVLWAGAEPTAYTDVNKAGAELRDHLTGRRVLLVVDDLWRRSDLTPFLGTGAALLVTTRDRQTLPRSCKSVEVDAMEPDESTALLARELISDGYVTDLIALRELAARLGHWPLLLDLVNRQLCELARDGLEVSEALAYVTRCLAEEGLTAFDIDDDQARRTAVERTMAVSLRGLRAEDRRCYEMLAVFPEDAEIPLDVLAHLWSLDQGAVRKLCERLFQRSMLLRYDRVSRTIRLHDVFRRYLIDMQGEGLRELHLRWLAAFCPKGRQWHELPQDEGYAWRYLAYHLREAGQGNVLHDLLTDYLWLDGKLRARGPAELIGDFAYLENGDEKPRQTAPTLIRDALRLSSHVLASDPGQLPSQLVGRLLGWTDSQDEDGRAISKLLAAARAAAPRPWLSPITASLTPPGGPFVRTLAGHMGAVRAVAVTPDGREVVSGSRDGTLKVWDLATGAEVYSFLGHAGPVCAVAVAPDGKQAISASRDRTLKVWDLASGVEVHTMLGHLKGANSLAVMPDSKQAISASADCTLKVWDLATGTVVRTLWGHLSSVTAVAIMPDGKQAISASRDHTLRVWDLASGLEVCTLVGHRNWVTAVAVTPDGKQAISASSDRTIKIWNLATGVEVRTLRGHSSGVVAVAVMPNGTHAISASLDGIPKVWDIVGGAEVRRLTGHSSSVRAISVLPDGNQVISGSDDRTLRLWSLSAGAEVQTRSKHLRGVGAVAIFPDGKQAVSASDDRTLKLWDLTTGTDVRTLSPNAGRVSVVAVMPDGKQVISAAEDHKLKVWDLADKTKMRVLSGHSQRVTAVAALPDGQQALSASIDCELRLWHLGSGTSVRTLSGHAQRVTAVAALPDGQQAISASMDRTLRVWHLGTGSSVRTIWGHSSPIRAVAVTPDGTVAISASEDCMLKVWDLGTGALVRTLSGHSGSVVAVASLPDGQQVISASEDRTLRIWDLASGRVLTSFVADGRLAAVAVSSDGHMIVAGDQIGNVHMLRLIDNVEPPALTPAAGPPPPPRGPMVTALLPPFERVSRDELLIYAARPPVLLVVVTDVERGAVLELLQPLRVLPAETDAHAHASARRLRGNIDQQTYYCGMFGAHRAVLTTCEMGAIGRDSAILSIQQAIHDLSPECVIMVGLAFGKDPTKQHLGQVLVSSQVISYEQQRVGATVVARGPKVEADGTLINRFRNIHVGDDWDFRLPDGSSCQYEIGPILSGEKLVDNASFKAELFTTYADAIGGEMEGAGLYAAAARARLPWILVKSICDWADGTKNSDTQPLAAAAAASLVHAVLSDRYALDGITPPSRQTHPLEGPAPHRIEEAALEALVRLLLSLFDSGALRRFVAYGPEGATIVSEDMPGEVATPAALAHAAVTAWKVRALITADLFARLTATRPGRAGDIEAVRQRFRLG